MQKKWSIFNFFEYNYIRESRIDNADKMGKNVVIPKQ